MTDKCRLAKVNKNMLLLMLYIGLTCPSCSQSKDTAQIPAVIEKRTNNINLVFAGYAPNYSLKEQEFIAKKFNLAILREYNCNRQIVSNLKKINPELKILIYENMFTSAPEAGSKEDKFYKNSHPDWFARDKKRGFVIHKSWPDWPKMDIGNKGWQEYYAKRALSILKATGADGVYIDEFNNYFNLGNEHSAEPANYTPENWKIYNRKFLESVKRELQNKYLIIYNGLVPMPDEFTIGKIKASNWHGKEYLDIADGAAVEGFISRHTYWDNFWKNLGYSGWDLSVGLLKHCSEKKKITLCFPTDDVTDKQSRLYSLCSFLLYQNKFTYFYYLDDARNFYFFPEWETDVGEPLGAYYQKNAVYQRDFEKAKILVNPGKNKISFSLPQEYKTLEGQAVSRITLNLHSGTILLK